MRVALTRLICKGCGNALWTDDGIALCSSCVPEPYYSIEEITSMWRMLDVATYNLASAKEAIQYIRDTGTCHHQKIADGKCAFVHCMFYKGKR